MANRPRVNIKEELADPERRRFLLALATGQLDGWKDFPESEPHQVLKPVSPLYMWIPAFFIIGGLALVNLFLWLAYGGIP